MASERWKRRVAPPDTAMVRPATVMLPRAVAVGFVLLAWLLTRTSPPVIERSPPKVLAPESVRIPAPDLASSPAPLMTPEITWSEPEAIDRVAPEETETPLE